MVFVKKKLTQIFSDGSLNFNDTFLIKLSKIKVNKKDHTTFIYNKKNSNLMLTDSKDLKNFKTQYLKF